MPAAVVVDANETNELHPPWCSCWDCDDESGYGLDEEDDRDDTDEREDEMHFPSERILRKGHRGLCPIGCKWSPWEHAERCRQAPLKRRGTARQRRAAARRRMQADRRAERQRLRRIGSWDPDGIPF